MTDPAGRTALRPLRVLVAPDSFKGSLGSVEVGLAIERGWQRGRPDDTVERAPIADGGDGTLDAILAADPAWLPLPVHARDPLGRPVSGRFLRRGEEAVVELADVSGLARVGEAEMDAQAASTFGTGQALAAAIGLGCRRIVLGVGGSATTDGGAGLLVALGARLRDADGDDLPDGGGALARLASIDLGELSPLLAEVDLAIASDVRNPLLGASGAAATYGPQKGATPEQVAALDVALARFADLVEDATGTHVREVPGAGAAGGTTAGLLAIADRFASLEIRPGIDVVMELTGFVERLERADLVVTGEGRVDAQTAQGKAALGVAARASAARVPCLVIAGGVEMEGAAALARLGAIVIPASEQPETLEAAMAAGAARVERAAERAARLVTLGERLGTRRG